MPDIVKMYRPVGPAELKLVEESGFKRWPARLPEQPLFYPVTNEQYATEITRKWNVRDYGVGYVTRFSVVQPFADRYEIHRVGMSHHTEWWIPAEDVEELNNSIISLIEVIAEYSSMEE